MKRVQSVLIAVSIGLATTSDFAHAITAASNWLQSLSELSPTSPASNLLPIKTEAMHEIGSRRVSAREETALLDLVERFAGLRDRESALEILRFLETKSVGYKKKSIQLKLDRVARVFFSSEGFNAYQEGLSLLTTSRAEEARSRLMKAADLEPSNVEVLIRMGQALVVLQESEAAISYLKKAFAFHPFRNEVTLWRGRAEFLAHGSVEALPLLAAATKALPGSETATLWYVEALAASTSTSDQTQAVALLRSAVVKKPNSAVLRLQYAELLKSRGAVALARDEIRKVLGPEGAKGAESKSALTFEPASAQGDLGFQPYDLAQTMVRAQAVFAGLEGR